MQDEKTARRLEVSTTIKTRIERSSAEDKIYIGMLIEKAMSGEFGAYLDCLWEGMQRATLDQSKQSGAISAERHLGRLEAVQMIKDELELLVTVKSQLLESKREDGRVHSAEEEYEDE